MPQSGQRRGHDLCTRALRVDRVSTVEEFRGSRHTPQLTALQTSRTIKTSQSGARCTAPARYGDGNKLFLDQQLLAADWAGRLARADCPRYRVVSREQERSRRAELADTTPLGWDVAPLSHHEGSGLEGRAGSIIPTAEDAGEPDASCTSTVGGKGWVSAPAAYASPSGCAAAWSMDSDRNSWVMSTVVAPGSTLTDAGAFGCSDGGGKSLRSLLRPQLLIRLPTVVPLLAAEFARRLPIPESGTRPLLRRQTCPLLHACMHATLSAGPTSPESDPSYAATSAVDPRS